MKLNNSLQSSWICSLPDDIAQDVRSHMSTMSLSRGNVLYRQGDMLTGVYEIKSGRVKASALRSSGTECILHIFYPPATLGEFSLIARSKSLFSAAALQDSVVAFLPEKAFSMLRETYPDINARLVKNMSVRLRIQLQLISNTPEPNIPTSLATRLHALFWAVSEDEHQENVRLEVKQDELASMLGCSRQTINQILKEWEEQGLVKIVYGGIQINNLNRLLSEVGGDGLI